MRHLLYKLVILYLQYLSLDGATFQSSVGKPIAKADLKQRFLEKIDKDKEVFTYEFKVCIICIHCLQIQVEDAFILIYLKI